MDLRVLLTRSMRPRSAHMTEAPYWRCDLAHGHTGAHVSIHAHEWTTPQNAA